MIGGVPRRPSGNSAQARFVQAVWDTLWGGQSGVRETPGALVSRTTRGSFVQPTAKSGGLGGNARVRQYLLVDASKPDYFKCRTLSSTVEDPEADPLVYLPSIGATDVFIAKPFQLRQTPFDRDVLNAADPTDIGTVNEVTYNIVVEILSGAVLTTETHKLSHRYYSATFRTVTDQTDANPANWFDENQTIIPRWIPATLAGDPPTTQTQGATIIYAVQCSNLLNLISDEDDAVVPTDLHAEPMLTDVADGEKPITLLALNDGWAWAKSSA